jgi:hypothetical protein
MSGRGQEETARLRRNIEEQLSRLLEQLEDLDTYSAELDVDEAREMREDTLEALQEMKHNLAKMLSGNITLVSELGALQLAIQAAVSSAFSTPEVVRMFATKNGGQLRARLAALQREQRLGKLASERYVVQAVEVLAALKKLGESLSEEEASFLSQHMTESMAAFEGTASPGLTQSAQQTLLSAAASSVKKAQK